MFTNSAMAYIELVSSFLRGLVITVNLAASQIKGSEMSTKEPHRRTEESGKLIQLKFITLN